MVGWMSGMWIGEARGWWNGRGLRRIPMDVRVLLCLSVKCVKKRRFWNDLRLPKLDKHVRDCFTPGLAFVFGSPFRMCLLS